MFYNILLVICRYDVAKIHINVVLIGTHSYKQLCFYVLCLRIPFLNFPGWDGNAAYARPYCSLYPDVLQLIPGGTAAYIVPCDFNENPKSDFDFDLGFVNMLSEKSCFITFCWSYVDMTWQKIHINVVLIGTHSYKQLYFYVL